MSKTMTQPTDTDRAQYRKSYESAQAQARIILDSGSRSAVILTNPERTGFIAMPGSWSAPDGYALAFDMVKESGGWNGSRLVKARYIITPRGSAFDRLFC